MYILAKLVLLNYIPDKFERNMRFVNQAGEVHGFIYSTMSLEHLIERNGYPVKPYIMPISANPDDKVEPLALPEQIGWWDIGPKADELRDITNKDLTRVMLEDDGILQLEVSIGETEDGIEFVTPVLYDGKVTIACADNEDMDFDEFLEELDED